ncbi:MAG: pseudouridine synthase [Planctomycetaceae bacterium]|nr:pseudouridine synthase [Planctomycetaceae bacterium]
MTISVLPSNAILYEDNHCLVVNKPSRLLTVGDQTQDVNLLDLAKEYLKQKYNKPGDVFLGVVHRLDRPVSGVVLFARTSKAASRLADQFRTRTMQKVYWTCVSGTVEPQAGTLEDWLLKDREDNFTTVVQPDSPGAKPCRLSYQRLASWGNSTLLEILPETGRSHQIRVQLAARGWSILGDRKYGSQESGGGSIALHAVQLTFQHPTLQRPIVVNVPPPDAWQEWNPHIGEEFTRHFSSAPADSGIQAD